MAALLATSFVSSCGPSNKPFSVGKPIPRLEAADEQPCVDPGVEGNAIQIVAAARLALAKCSEKHSNVVDQYNKVRQKFGPQ